MYEEFRDRAAGKIEQIVGQRLDKEPVLSRYLDQGADPLFDRVLEKMGLLARRRPRVIIELLLVWRKTTVDAADEYAAEAPMAVLRAQHIVRERRSLASVYILCRALGAVVGQLEAGHLEGDLGDRLEELVFGQVKQVNPGSLRRSQNRREIQELYARLIGRISEIRFASMSDRFIAELERIPMVSGGNDERIVVLLHNMRFLKLRVFPIDALEESSAFLLSCAKFYSRTTGSMRLKHAWATLLAQLLMPMAAFVDAEVNLPELVQAIDIIYAKAMKMAAKVRHVHVAFPLAAATLCISRRDVFHQRWLSLLEFCIQRLKDKQFRRVSMDAILRMLWVYLFRYPEAPAVVLRRIDSLSRIFFPATKLHAWPKTVPPAAFAYFLTCAACYNFDFTMRQLLKNMLQIDSGWPGTSRDIVEPGPVLDTLNPARVGLAFQALVSVAAIASNREASVVADSGSAAKASSSLGHNHSGRPGSVAKSSGSDGLSAIHPPFPGVAQLSGLDVFEATSSPGNHSQTAHHTGTADVRGSAAGHSNAGSLGASAAMAASAGCFMRYPPNAALPNSLFVDPDGLPDNIKSALITAIGVVTRYFNVLCPVFGNFVLADERLWRLTRTMPPMSSVVLTGESFSFGNTSLMQSSRDQQAVGTPAGVSANAAVGDGSGAGSSSGAAARADDAGDASGAAGGAAGRLGGDASGITGNFDNPTGSSDLAASVLRQTAPRYPAERQVYLDLMTVYVRNVSRSRLFWEQTDVARLIETLVQNILHVDQALAAQSRATLMDLLCPPSIRQSAANSQVPFASCFDRLDAIVQALVRATQALRATDERFMEILVGGVFSRDYRSCVPFAQPGDPLGDTPGAWPFGMAANNNSSRRFMHAANPSTTSNNSAGIAAPAADTLSRSFTTGAVSDHEDPDTKVRQSIQVAIEGAADEGESSASSISLDTKARLQKTTLESMSASVGELNGGFLHVYLDLAYYLEIALTECLAEDNNAASASDNGAVDIDRDAADGRGGGANDQRKVAGQSLAGWAGLLGGIEANSIAILCSSNVRARRLCVDVLYQAAALRRIIAVQESLLPAGHPSWVLRGTESAYE
ncbi:Cell morphogenesis protein PAG1, partial [Coemansia asiatica]